MQKLLTNVALLFFTSCLIVHLTLGDAQKCTPGKAKLVNGTSENEGVFMYCTKSGTWRIGCKDHLYSCTSRSIACKQAGFDTYVSSYSNYTALRLNRQSNYDRFYCSSFDDSLLDCYQSSRSYCFYALGLKCANLSLDESNDTKCETRNDVRLVEGRRPSEGQLQVCRSKQWRDVCTSYATNVAKIACKKLGYSGNWVIATNDGHFYNSSSSLAMYTRISCYGSYYTSLGSCSFTQSDCVRCQGSELAISCLPEKTDCKQNEVRLVGGSNSMEGLVEVCVDGVWGKVRGAVEGHTKDRICSTLGYNKTGAILVTSYSTLRSYESGRRSPYLVKYINCCEKDESFNQCEIHYASLSETLSGNILALHCIDGCTNGETRLKGGDTRDEGVVQYCVGGNWRSVGLDGWDDVDANVVCQNLYPGKKYAYAVATNSTQFPDVESRKVIYSGLKCKGSEASITDCRRSYMFSTITTQAPTAAVRCHPQCNCTDNSSTAT